MNKLYRYIPEKAMNIIEEGNYPLKEHLYIICDMIYRIGIFRKEDQYYSNTYVDIHHSYFRDIITFSTSFTKAKDYLISEGIIECDNHSSKKNGKALGYRFQNELISKLIPVEIIKKTLKNKIIINRQKRNNLVNYRYKEYKEHFLDTFKIDADAALDYINVLFDNRISELRLKHANGDITDFLKGFNKITNQFNHLYMTIHAIKDGQLFFNQNDTNNRIDTNLTSLKSELKQFIINQFNLIQIDIINSQPFLLSIILNEEKNSNIDQKELIKYTNWTREGSFYEKFTEEYIKKYNSKISRKEIKELMFCIFYSKNESYIKQKAIFKNIFPTISHWIQQQKSQKHNALSIKMQKFESEICIDYICQKLDLNKIKYYTIHDAWLVKEEDILITHKIIEDCFTKHYNTKPKLDLKPINNIKQKIDNEVEKQLIS